MFGTAKKQLWQISLDHEVSKNLMLLNSVVYFYVVVAIEKRIVQAVSSIFDCNNHIKVNMYQNLVFVF